ncbi:MAG: hypothetical protein NC121_19955 [Blautia sp.]|nr:hypothetical protein [Blautia sp.]
MKDGFYTYRNNIYYGSYDEGQVSGRLSLSIAKPEQIQTDHPICKDGWAVRLWDNHALLEPEYADLQKMLLQMSCFMHLNTTQEIDLSIVEERLAIPFPRELRLIYTAISGQEEYFTGVEHFLPLDEICEEQGLLIFFRKKKTPQAGYILENGCLATYRSKMWHMEQGGFSCYQFCMSRMLTIALENKPVTRKGRCKGRFVTTLNIVRELEPFCNDKYHLLSEYNVYGIAVMYSEDGLIAWIRSNGSYADIHAGGAEEAHLEAFGEHLGGIVWK